MQAEPGLQDFWRVYDRHYDEISELSMVDAREHPEFGPLIATFTPEMLLQQRTHGRDMLRRAVDGEWDAYVRVMRWTSAAERLKGYRADEIIGQPFSIFYPPEERSTANEELATAVRDGRFEDEGWRVRKDGSRFWANVVVTPIRDEKGA